MAKYGAIRRFLSKSCQLQLTSASAKILRLGPTQRYTFSFIVFLTRILERLYAADEGGVGQIWIIQKIILKKQPRAAGKR
jgi:hypothetical protein